MTFQMLYNSLRTRHKDQHMSIHGKTEKPIDVNDDTVNVKVNVRPRSPFICFCAKFASEFRFIIITVLIVVSALTLQHSFEETIEIYVKPALGAAKARNCWMYLLSFLLITLTILIVIFWSPVIVPPKKVKVVKTEEI